jgi:hypothetical protein
MSTEAQYIVQTLNKKNEDHSIDCGPPCNTRLQTQVHRYAWLEHENGSWHFLTSLFADPAESTRRWPDRKLALDELISEGWTVIRSYHERPSRENCLKNCIHGYGLMITIH